MKVKKSLGKAKAPKTKKVVIGKGSSEKKITAAETPVQDGIQPTNVKLKDKPPEGYATIGLAIGATINVGDYQSARIDVFIQRNVPDSDEDIKDGYKEISELLHEELQKQSAELLEE